MATKITPLVNEPNQAEIDRKAAEKLQAALEQRRAAQEAAAKKLQEAQKVKK